MAQSALVVKLNELFALLAKGISPAGCGVFHWVPAGQGIQVGILLLQPMATMPAKRDGHLRNKNGAVIRDNRGLSFKRATTCQSCLLEWCACQGGFPCKESLTFPSDELQTHPNSCPVYVDLRVQAVHGAQA